MSPGRVTWSSCESRASFPMSGATPLSSSINITRILKKYSSQLNNIASFSHGELNEPNFQEKSHHSFIHSTNIFLFFFNLLLNIVLCAEALTMNKGRQHMCTRGPYILIRGDRQPRNQIQVSISALKKVSRVLTENYGGSAMPNEDTCYRDPGGALYGLSVELRYPTSQPVFNFLKSNHFLEICKFHLLWYTCMHTFFCK